MRIDHFQEEETYLFSSLLGRLRDLSHKDASIATRCLLAIFWRVYGEKRLFELLLEGLEKEIEGYGSDPTREPNRTKKVFACAIYKNVSKKVKQEEKIQNYLSYAIDSNWLGQPRIACCLSFLENDPLGENAKDYLRENFGAWLSEGRDDFIAIGLLALRKEISQGLFLIGISQIHVDLPNKNAVEDRLYQAIRKNLIATTSVDDEVIITSTTALFLAKYHKISGYFDKYSSELRETLALKDRFVEDKKRAKIRNLVLCITFIAFLGLACLMFFIPTIVEFKANPSVFGKILLTLNTKKGWALASAIVLTGYVLVSYLKRGDPVFGIVEYLRERFPGLFKSNKERQR
ncbi:MAG: hypothetical protein JRG69_14045 [Deltaproteobacteria bacterium]|nr:hypothetical protein [Deltaproteobacteria bacterium]